jgi:hypothetical protein
MLEMLESLHSPTVRVLFGTFVFIIGSLVTFFSLFGSSFGFTATAAVVAITGLLWYFWPSVAVRLLIAPAFLLADLLLHTPAAALSDNPLSLACFLFLLFLLGLIIAEFWTTRYIGWVSISFSFVLVLCAFGVERLFTNKESVEVRWMHWSSEQAPPWGRGFGPARDDGVILYEEVPGGYCFNTVVNRELQTRLAESGKSLVKVEFNAVRNFGKLRLTNIRSVDGLAFIEDNRIVRDGQSSTGSVGAPMVPCP